MPSIAPSYDYSTGTLSIASGDNVVVGSGLGATGWGGAVARRGDQIILDYGGPNEKVSIIVNTVPGHTDQLEIPRYTGPDLVDVDYIIYWISPTRVAGAEAVEDITRLVNYLNSSGIFVYVDVADSVPNPSLGENGQQALQPLTGKAWVKTGGVWVFIGTFKGFNFIDGGYNPATTYNELDVFIHEGNTYLVVAETTGNVPPNATYYRLMAAAGLAGTVTVGTTTTLAPGVPATVTNSGNANAAVLNFGIPAGLAATVDVDSTVTGAAGTLASVTNVGNPVNASFQFTVPRGANGLDGGTTLPVVRVVSTVNINITNGLEAGDTVGGAVLGVNDQVLLAGQTVPAQNGIYVAVASGAASRHPSYNSYDSMCGIYVSVLQGTDGNSLWQCKSDRGGTLGTDALEFSKFADSSAGQQARANFTYTATAGQTTFSGLDIDGENLGYTPGAVEVAVNGSWLPPADYTATTGLSIVLNGACTVGDVVYVTAFSTFSAADTFVKSQNGADILDKPLFRENIGLINLLQNISLDRIYASKAFGSYRRVINSFATGFRGATDALNGILTGSSSNYAVNTVAGFTQPTIGAAGTQILAAQTLNSDNPGVNGFSFRQRILAGAFSGSGTVNIAITIAGPAAGAAQVIAAAYIGHQGVTAPNFDGAQVQLTVGGSTSFTIPIGGSVTTDPVTFAYNNTKNLIISYNLTSSTQRINTSGAGANFDFWFKSAAAEAANTTVTGYTIVTATNMISGPIKVDFLPANMTLVSTPQTTDVSVSNARVLMEFDNTANLTPGTDFTIEASCNGGTNWFAASIYTVVTNNSQGGRKVVETNNIACTAGTSFQYRLKTLTNKNMPEYGITIDVGN